MIFDFGNHRSGKTMAMVETTKAAQRQGKKVVWVTSDVTATAQRITVHGGLCEVLSDQAVVPHFKEPSDE